MSMCESILTIALVCTVKYLHYCDYYYTLGNDSQSTPKLIAYFRFTLFIACVLSETRTPCFIRLQKFPKSHFHLYFLPSFCNISAFK